MKSVINFPVILSVLWIALSIFVFTKVGFKDAAAICVLIFMIYVATMSAYISWKKTNKIHPRKKTSRNPAL